MKGMWHFIKFIERGFVMVSFILCLLLLIGGYFT